MTERDSNDRLSNVLRRYVEHPMRGGSVALLLDDRVCMEVEDLADEWDELLKRNLAGVLRKTARTVVVAVARPGAELLPSDYQLWRDLHEELKGSDVDLKPLRGMPGRDDTEPNRAAS